MIVEQSDAMGSLPAHSRMNWGQWNAALRWARFTEAMRWSSQPPKMPLASPPTCVQQWNMVSPAQGFFHDLILPQTAHMSSGVRPRMQMGVTLLRFR